jgi:molybdopterin molybdotransferase
MHPRSSHVPPTDAPTNPALSYTEGCAIVDAQAASVLQVQPQPQSLPLHEALGRVLAAPICADRDQPPFDRSTRDGYAVRAQDVCDDAPLLVLGQIRAGEAWPADQPAITAGMAVEIMTGAPLPPGTDAVLMIEHALAGKTPGSIQPAPGRTLTPGTHVVARASEARAGAVLVSPGTRIGTAQIAVAASCGLDQLAVYAQPRVAILATGDELVEPGHPRPQIAEQQIFNSNSHSTAALIAQAGAIPLRLPLARDTHASIAAGISAARDLSPDLLLLTGGVSMGKYDLVEAVLAEFGAEFFFTGLRIQPGKPLVFGRLPARTNAGKSQPALYFFGLPGNPISTMVTFTLFVRPLLATLAGERNWQTPFVLARLAQDVQHPPGLTRFLPAWLDSTQTEPSVTPVAWRGSGDLAAQARANCLLVIPEDSAHLPAGTLVRILRME